jgi:signal transduction histidine kinase
MIFHRLTVRGRVNLLAFIPILVVILLTVPLLAGRLGEARAARAAERAASAAGRVSSLIEMVQRARLLSIAFMSASGVAQNSLTIQLQKIDQRRAELVADAEIAEIPDLHKELDGLQLDFVGTSALTGWGSDLQIVDDYGRIVTGIVDALELTRNDSVDREGASRLETLDALLRSDEAASRRAALLLLAATNPTNREQALTSAREMGILQTVTADQFRRTAEPSDASLFALADAGPTARRLTAAEVVLTGAEAGTRTPTLLAAQVLASGQSQTEIRQLVESRIARDAVERARQTLEGAWWTTFLLGGLGLGVLVLVLGLSVAVGRSVTGPLRSLTFAAGQVADLAQGELLHVADEDAQEARAPRLAAIDIRDGSEIGELATAFNRVQTTAALLLDRQVTSRRNVASMFASIGRRTSNLVGRQLGLIDSLERAEDDPDTLATLYRLDHTATRLRRNASALVVLSGGTEAYGEGQPVTIGDVVRGALGTVEGYQRVTLRAVPLAWVGPGTVGDLSLLIAELLDNALSYSPPRTQVEVTASLSALGSYAVSIVDHGMGMPEERLAEENVRLRRRERLDLAPSDVLGLFVVGRIARRHSIDVTLRSTEGNGVTAVVAIPASVMVDVPALAPPPEPSPRRWPADRATDPATGSREAAARVPGATLPGATVPGATVPGATVPGSGTAPVARLPQRVRGQTLSKDTQRGDMPPDAPRPLARRVRGASLRARPDGQGPAVPGTGQAAGFVAAVPESPLDVLSWTRDLESAMERLATRDGQPGTEGERQ